MESRWTIIIIIICFCYFKVSSLQLDNIRNHIKLTKEHIDALNVRFAGYQNPPGIYLSE